MARLSGPVRFLLIAIAVLAGATATAAQSHALTPDKQAYQDAGVPFSWGDFATARKLYLALLERQSKLGFAPDALPRLAVLFQLARCEHALGDQRAAHARLKPVIANLGKMQGAAAETLLVMLDLQAKVTNQLELWSEEADALSRALALFTPRSGLTALDRIDLELRRSLVLMRLGRVEEGRALRRATLRDQAAAPELAGEVASNMNFVGNLLANAGFNEDAVDVFRELQQRAGATPSMPLAVSHFNLAVALRNLNRLDEAIDAGRKAAEMLEQVRGPNDRRTLSAFGGLGQNYDFAGRYVLARQWLGDAYARARAAFGADDADTMLYANNLADVYRRLGDLAAAERLDREALTGRLRRFGENSVDTRASRGNLAIDLQLLGRYAEAADVLKPLLANLTATLGADHAETLEVRRRIASLNLSAGRLDEAEKSYAAYASDAALERLEPAKRVYLLNARAAIAEKRGRRAEELKLRERTLALAREALGPDHPDTLQFFADVLHNRPASVTELGELNARVLDWARREVATSADPQTRQRLLSLFSTTRNLVVNEAFRRPDAEHRALLVTAMERWKGVGLREDQLLARLAGEGGDAKTAALARELAEHNGSGAGTNTGGAAAPRVAELRTQLSQTSPAYAQARRRAEVSLADIAAALRPGELFLDIWVVPASERGRTDDDRIVAALIGPDGVRSIRRLGDVGTLTPFLRIENVFAEGRIAEAAYNDFIAPFLADIAGVDRLYVSADGPLHLVPFDALRTPQGRYLVEDIALEMVRSGASLVAMRKGDTQKGDTHKGDAAPRSGVVIADAIDYGRGPNGETPAPPLAGQEGPAVAGILRGAGFGPVELVTGRAASESWLMGLAAPRILHLSTHGMYQGGVSASDNPLALAAIALAGANEDYGRGNSGMLTAAEAMGLKLDGSDLVVLSACETARGGATYAEGLAGLPSALAIAGARRTLLALWPVTDSGTTAFMRRFYERLAAAPDDYAGALRAAKLDAVAGRLAGTEGKDDWKAFVLIRN